MLPDWITILGAEVYTDSFIRGWVFGSVLFMLVILSAFWYDSYKYKKYLKRTYDIRREEEDESGIRSQEH